MSDESNKENILEKTLKEVHDELIYKDQMGQKTTVKRSNIGGDAAIYQNENLRQIGKELQSANQSLKELEYLGSAAIHYYRAPLTKATAFVSQTGSLKGVPEIICQDGVTDLRNAMLEMYGHRGQHKRSGF